MESTAQADAESDSTASMQAESDSTLRAESDSATSVRTETGSATSVRPEPDPAAPLLPESDSATPLYPKSDSVTSLRAESSSIDARSSAHHDGSGVFPDGRIDAPTERSDQGELTTITGHRNRPAGGDAGTDQGGDEWRSRPRYESSDGSTADRVADSGDSTQTAIRFWPDVVDTILVHDKSIGDETATGTGFSTHIPLGVHVAPTRELADLLDRAAGIHVHRYGGLGSYSVASMRGSSAGHVRIYLDGFPLTTARDGFTDLSRLPLAQLDHASIARGAQTHRLGGPSGAGVIQLFTAQNLSAPLSLAASTGSFDTRTFQGQWGRSTAKFGALISGSLRRSNGNYTYLDRHGTLLNPEDDREVERQNNEFEDKSILWKTAAQPLATFGMDYTGQAYHRHGGVPGTESQQTNTTHEREKRTRHQLGARWRPPLPFGAGAPSTLALSGFLESSESRFSNLDGEVGLGKTDQDDRGRVEGAQIEVLLPIARKWQIGALHYRDREEWTPTDRLREERGFTRARKGQSTVLFQRWEESALALEASYRWDSARDNYGGPVVFGQAPQPSADRTLRHEAPTFGARWNITRQFALKANRGKFLRYPTFVELFGDGGTENGNPALLPEQGLQWDAGVAWTPEWPIRAEAAYFETTTDGKIVQIQNSQRSTKSFNLDRAWVRGVEATAWTEHRLFWTVKGRLSSNVTWQEAIDVGKSRTYRGKRLPSLPETESYEELELSRPGWSLRYGLATRTPAYRDRYNSPAKKAEGYSIQDLGLEKSWRSDQLSVLFEVRNVRDRRVQDIDGFPLPGRTWSLETRVRI